MTGKKGPPGDLLIAHARAGKGKSWSPARVGAGGSMYPRWGVGHQVQASRQGGYKPGTCVGEGDV